MSEDFEREERAFAEALRKDAPVESFRPLDAEAIKAAARPARSGRTRWLKGMAAAAVLVVAVGIGAALLPRMVASAPTAAPAASGGYAAGGAVPETANDRATVAAQPKASAAASDWEKIASPPLTPRMNASGGWANGRFYIVGGHVMHPGCTQATLTCAVDSNRLLDGASYDPVTGSWQSLPEAPIAVSPDAPAVVGKRLYYVATGTGSRGTPSVVAALDSTSDTWMSIPSPGAWGTLIAAGDRLVNVAGDSSGRDQVFDTTGQVWVDLPRDVLGTNHLRYGAWADGKLVVTARRAAELVAPVPAEASYVRLETLDLATGTWRRLPTSRILAPGPVRAVGHHLVVGNFGREWSTGREYGAFDVKRGKWSDISMSPSGDGGVDPSVIDSAETVVAGQWLLMADHLYDPATGAWLQLQLPDDQVRTGATAAGGPDGLLVFGGWNGDEVDGDQLVADAYYLRLR